MKKLEVLLIGIPAIIMCGYTMYMKSIHDGDSKQHAIHVGWAYAILTAGFFVLLYLAKFSSIALLS